MPTLCYYREDKSCRYELLEKCLAQRSYASASQACTAVECPLHTRASAKGQLKLSKAGDAASWQLFRPLAGT